MCLKPPFPASGLAFHPCSAAFHWDETACAHCSRSSPGLDQQSTPGSSCPAGPCQQPPLQGGNVVPRLPPPHPEAPELTWGEGRCGKSCLGST